VEHLITGLTPRCDRPINPTEIRSLKKLSPEPKKSLDGSFDLFENVRSIFGCQPKIQFTVLLEESEDMPHARYCQTTASI
jgi:hypothetical protein